MSTNCTPKLLTIPQETILHIFSFLDLPDLAAVSKASTFLANLASDPVLHRTRIYVVAPSRISHSLFGQSPQGVSMRPTVGDLVQRNVMRGLSIERRWRMGLYFYTSHSVRQYESGLRLQRRHACIVLASHLRRRFAKSASLQTLHRSHVLPDVESSSLSISRSLLPVMRQLKWCIQRDTLARMVREADKRRGGFGFGTWLERKGRGVVEDGERVRLAVCPGVKKMIGHYEQLGC